jgi:ribosome-associated heat shock protein Hsp15
MRLDKWLWAARFYKTRSLAADAIARGRVEVDGTHAKASRGVRVGSRIALREPPSVRTVVVRGLSEARGPTSVAQALYAETLESVAAREAAIRQRRAAPEPALTIEQGRPTKRDRRKLVEWTRWSAEAGGKPRG